MSGINNIFPAGEAAPVGSIVMWPTATPPTDWLILDGSTFSGATYPELAALLGGTTLPDMSNLFPLGVGAEPVLTQGGTLFHDHTQPTHTHTQPTHTHTGPDHAHTITHTHDVDPPNTTSTATGSVASGLLGLLVNAAPPNHTHDVNIPPFTSGTSSAANTGNAGTGNTGSGGGDVTGTSGGDTVDANFNIPPYRRLNFIIRAA